MRIPATAFISADGKKWYVKWRSYSWLEGASEPDQSLIDANPEILLFKKLEIEAIK